MLEVFVDEFLESEERLVVDEETIDDVDLVAQAAEEFVVLAHGFDYFLSYVGFCHVVVGELCNVDHGIVVLQGRAEVVEQSVECVDALASLVVADLHEGAAAGDLLRLVALHDDGESIDVVLFAVDVFEDSLRDEVEVARGAYDIEHLRACAAEHDGAGFLEPALVHDGGDIVDEGDVEVDENDFALWVFVESLVVGEDIVAAHNLVVLD